MRRGILAFSVIVGLIIAISWPCSGKRIKALLTGQVDEASNPLLTWFEEEPLVDARSVPTRPGGMVGVQEIKRFVRIYFPRSYDEVKSYDFIMLHSPIMYYFDDKQALWMYDAIREGTGSLSAPACMSSSADIYNAWIASILSKALPNDAAAVIESGGPKGRESFHIKVNREFPEPVLIPFIPLGIETFMGAYAYRIIPKEGAKTLAWQIGGFNSEIPYMATWNYEKGRTMTLGDSFGLAFWSSYAGRTSQNPYSLDILMNMVLYLSRRKVPTEVLVFHRMRTSFIEYRTKMGLLVSLMEFVQGFGANDRRIDGMVGELQGRVSEAEKEYLSGNFDQCQSVMDQVFTDLRKVEQMTLKLKERALLWVFMVEWLVVTATLMISSFLVWTIMIRRRLYKAVHVTRLA